MSTSVLIFAHYHAQGLLRDDTVELLQEAQRYFSVIIFVSTHIVSEEVKKISDITYVIQRPNVGYDFFSYREGLLALEENKIYPDFYFLANSSFICTDAKKFWHQIFFVSLEKDFLYGVTRSFEVSEHVQSYFLIFSREIFVVPCIYDWWIKMTPISERMEVVFNYEIGFSSLILNSGFKLQPIFEHQGKEISPTIGLDDRYRYLFHKYIDKNFNPTSYHWVDLEKTIGIIKIEMIKSNPCNMDLLPLLRRVNESAIFREKILQALEN